MVAIHNALGSLNFHGAEEVLFADVHVIFVIGLLGVDVFIGIFWLEDKHLRECLSRRGAHIFVVILLPVLFGALLAKGNSKYFWEIIQVVFWLALLVVTTVRYWTYYLEKSAVPIAQYLRERGINP